MRIRINEQDYVLMVDNTDIVYPDQDELIVVESLPEIIQVDGKECRQRWNGTEVVLEYTGIPAEPTPEPTLSEQVASLKEQNLVLMDAIATLFETVIGGA